MSLTRKQKKRLLIGAMTGIVVIAVMIIVFVTGHTNDKNKDIIDLTDTSKPKATSTPAPTVSPTPTPTPTPSPTPVPKDYSRIDEFLESITSGDIFYTKGEILKLMEGNFPEDEIEYASKHYPYSDDESAERVIEEAKKSGLSKTGFKTYLESFLPTVVSFFWSVVLALLCWVIGAKLIKAINKIATKPSPNTVPRVT